MKSHICNLLAALLFLAAVGCGTLAYRENKPFSVARIKQEAVISTVVTEPEVGAEVRNSPPLERQIDFETLRKINPDIAGWIYAPQANIDYPVLRGKNNTEYLNKDFEGQYSPLGSVFTWAHTNEKLADGHLCLFGHNTSSGQIFGDLDYFLDEAFCQENPYIYLYTPERTKEFKVQSVFSCDKSDEVFQDDWEAQGQQTVTLATCVGYQRTPERLTVNCKVVREKLIL